MEKKTVKKIELKEEELSKVVGGTTSFFDIKKFTHKNFRNCQIFCVNRSFS